MLPQDRETPVQTYSGAFFTCRFAYARAADTARAGDVGQDYAAFVEGDRYLALALCDGVSQSFYGDLAARFLGHALLRWLDGPAAAVRPGGLESALRNYLADLTAPGTGLVMHHPLPPGLPRILHEVLEQKRVLGSETTFVCGRIDLPCKAFPYGRLLVARMGDSRIRLWGSRGERTSELNGGCVTAERWSTRTGPVGELRVQALPLADVTAVAAYSDGLHALDKHPALLSDDGLRELIADAGGQPTSDDVSYLDVRLPAVRAPGFSWLSLFRRSRRT